MIFRILGDLEIGPDDDPVPLPNGHALEVLAGLLLNANRQLSTAELIMAAWGDPHVNAAQLHKAVSVVRGLLDRLGLRDSLITKRGVGYQLVLRDEDLDSLTFRRLVRDSDDARAAHRTDDELALLWQALRLWRGQHPASNVPDHRWSHSTKELEQQRKRAALRLFRLEIGRRNYEAILDDLALMTRYHPADGRLHEQRLVALYRCGDADEAVEVFERHREAVEQRMGSGPERIVRELAYAISNGDEAAVGAIEATIARREAGAEEQAHSVPRQLPPAPAVFVGRTDVVAEIHWLLNQKAPTAAPVLLIAGPAGMGKTALMRHVAGAAAHNYPDGQLYVELRGTVGPTAELDDVLAGFLRAFGVTHVPETTGERLSTYRTLTADRRVLILLDDAADEEQIRELIPANPGCAVVVTSRRRLSDLDGAHHVPVLKALSPGEAIEMFERLVAGSGSPPSNDATATERLVALCAGLPLAIRIVATLRARDRLRSTDELAQQLTQHGLPALTAGLRSVARAIGASFQALSAEAQSLFLRLALCRLPDFGLWTAAALVAGTGVDSVGALSSLAEYSMVDTADSPEEAERGRRYRFHDLTREYAYGQALEEYPAQRRRVVAAQVYAALLSLLRRAHRTQCGGDFDVVHADVPEWDAPAQALAEVDAAPATWFRRERLNIRTAVEQCADLGLSDLCWDLAISTHEFYTLDGQFDDWLHTHATALKACRAAGDRRGEAVMLVGLGQPALVASRPSGSVATPADLEYAIDLLAEVQDEHGLAIAKRTLANALRRRGQLARPLLLFTEALGHYEASSDVLGHWQTLRYIAHTYLDRGDPREALRLLGQALEVARTRLSGGRPVAQTKYWMGQAYLAVDDLPAARDAFSDMLALFPEPAGSGHAYAVHGLGDVARRSGELDRAQAYLALAARLSREAADGTLEGRVALSLAGLRRAQNEPVAEVAELVHAAECFAAADAAYLHLHALAELGRAEARRGDDDAAMTAMRRVQKLYAALDLPEQDRVHRVPAIPES